ncbi:rhodanese-like domain-containing protein [uncultured Maribacter sp.]|uniref:rhodanese-like domain-containing protein n=1 Tax=uncultured Maribacter sp. TaxID=431308 RepID=UPI0026144545|nr:rhodanese-like domain-containing protein [uncultured Maribacter sp.]
MSFLTNIFGRKKDYSDSIKVLNKSAFSSAISNKKVQLIDVRTPNEFTNGHIGNAVNVDFFKSDTFVSYFEKLDISKPVYLYCRSGARSRKAAHKLVDMGFKEIYDLQGGYSKW